jgi:hypothetical protein
VLFSRVPTDSALGRLLAPVYSHTDTILYRPDTFFVKVWGIIDTNGFRLPSESEWEAIARCGMNINYSTNTGGLTADNAVYGTTAPAAPGDLRSNPWSLIDMTGNLAEWTNTWWSDHNVYADSAYPKYVPWKVLKGGSFADKAGSRALTISGGASAHPDSLLNVMFPDSTVKAQAGYRLVVPGNAFWDLMLRHPK